MITLQFYIPTMRCAGCVRKIETSINSLEKESVFDIETNISLIDHTLTVKAQKAQKAENGKESNQGFAEGQLEDKVSKYLTDIGYPGSLISIDGLEGSVNIDLDDSIAGVFSVESEQKR